MVVTHHNSNLVLIHIVVVCSTGSFSYNSPKKNHRWISRNLRVFDWVGRVGQVGQISCFGRCWKHAPLWQVWHCLLFKRLSRGGVGETGKARGNPANKKCDHCFPGTDVTFSWSMMISFDLGFYVMPILFETHACTFQFFGYYLFSSSIF